MAQGCSLSPVLFSAFINDLLKEVEEAGAGMQLSNDKSLAGMLFANYFVGVIQGRTYRSLLM